MADKEEKPSCNGSPEQQVPRRENGAYKQNGDPASQRDPEAALTG